MKNFLKKYAPPGCRKIWGAFQRGKQSFRLRRAVRQALGKDAVRYLRYAIGTRSVRSRENLQAWILMLSHSIEKGLSLPDPRPMFGAANIRDLLYTLNQYMERHGNDWVVCSGTAALKAYCLFNRAAVAEGAEASAEYNAAENWLNKQASDQAGFESGTYKTTAEELRRCGKISSDFFFSRYSIRNFSPAPVDETILREAVRIAGKSPSVCNRQAWRVKLIRRPDLIEKVQTVAGGARGFAEKIGTLAIVTSDLSCFYGETERNQAWIDGGIFVMSFLYALHALGLGGCCLNCCLKPAEEQRIRQLLNLPESEVMIARIAIGHYAEKLEVAVSPRWHIDEILTVYK